MGLFGSKYMFQFAFIALPPILFVSAFFTLLYHWGILQRCVRVLARIMVHLMGTQRRRNVIGVRQCVHGTDGSAAHRETMGAAHDELRAFHFDGKRHGPHLRRHDGCSTLTMGPTPLRC